MRSPPLVSTGAPPREKLFRRHSPIHGKRGADDAGSLFGQQPQHRRRDRLRLPTRCIGTPSSYQCSSPPVTRSKLDVLIGPGQTALMRMRAARNRAPGRPDRQADRRTVRHAVQIRAHFRHSRAGAGRLSTAKKKLADAIGNCLEIVFCMREWLPMNRRRRRRPVALIRADFRNVARRPRSRGLRRYPGSARNAGPGGQPSSAALSVC